MTDATLSYIALVLKEEDTLLISFPDIPEAITFVTVEDRNKAPETAIDCLVTALDSRVRDKETFPKSLYRPAKDAPLDQFIVCTINLEPYIEYLKGIT